MLNSALLSLAGFLAAANAMPATHVPGRNPNLARQEVVTPAVDIAAIMSVPQDSFTSYHVGSLERASSVNETSAVAKRWTCSSTPILTWGDTDDGGLGVTVTNADSVWRGFYIYHNSVSATTPPPRRPMSMTQVLF